ncbi:uncharacterized protein PFL1_01384 [Pseudozyma flocculosa PF-1]|uniref:Probable protein CCN1 - putative cell cycle control protein n=1 Tax=Pseudozyma flocculosa TaxID=84751 RepID=A0A5C3EVN8_9BASI|nr:uncharacterized protein PFL1_01384 [Pseudozyma flocculosa PF-1]EPQ31196.1 hypothetical protein PFL1_01384 [Pseudozyma flocculosa PF-1]SPO36308.1 probable protein CCN1 - putative cell cycle control protein [Pseudozyma flocculosa]
MSRDARAPRIKNRAPAPIQISAEQLLREAQERQEAPQHVVEKSRVEDYEELEEYRGRKRKEFEESVGRMRSDMNRWIKYATWEAGQGEMDRCRSIYERAIDVDPQSAPLWIRYTEQELKVRNVQHARNLYDRAVTILPRIDQLWYKYVHLEELLGNIAGTRQVFERWMSWEPDEKAWSAYIAMELRYNEAERASAIWERAVTCHPTPRQWIRWAKFEEDRGALDKARTVFQMALDFIGEDETAMEKAQTVFTAFAKMETRQKEYERARVIYKYALERLPRAKSEGIYASYTRFEKQFGTTTSVEDTVIGKRRIQYEEELSADGGSHDYDTWFDYTRLEEDAYRALASAGGADDQLQKARARVRDLYERAIANVPPSNDKRHWRRYIFLWLRYALFEEIDVRDYDRAREVFKAAIAVVPHRSFTFAKLWINYAHFEVRRLDLPAARKIMGAAIGMAPKERLFRAYVDLELSLKEFDRARKIYERALEWDATNSRTWVKFAELERNLFDTDRARALYELGVRQADEAGSGGLDMPEVLWKAYIDFEFEEREWERVDALYERLLERSAHVKVWISYALSKIGQAVAEEEDEDEGDDEDGEGEGGDGEETEKPPRVLTDEQIEERQRRRQEAKQQTRKVFERAYQDLKGKGLKEERVVLLESWKTFEQTHGDAESLEAVQAKMPRVVKKRRELGDGSADMEEYYDLLFPDDEEQGKPSFKLLQMAHAWRAAQAAKAAAAAAAAGDGAAEDGAEGGAEGGADGEAHEGTDQAEAGDAPDGVPA